MGKNTLTQRRERRQPKKPNLKRNSMNIIKAFFTAIDGHKTDILVVAGVALWLGIIADLWTMDDVKELLVLLGMLGVATFRDALRKE